MPANDWRVMAQIAEDCSAESDFIGAMPCCHSIRCGRGKMHGAGFNITVPAFPWWADLEAKPSRDVAEAISLTTDFRGCFAGPYCPNWLGFVLFVR